MRVPTRVGRYAKRFSAIRWFYCRSHCTEGCGVQCVCVCVCVCVCTRESGCVRVSGWVQGYVNKGFGHAGCMDFWVYEYIDVGVWMSACMDVCMHDLMYACMIGFCMYACMHVCMHDWMFIWMYRRLTTCVYGHTVVPWARVICGKRQLIYIRGYRVEG